MRSSGLNWQGLMEQLEQALPNVRVSDDALAYFRHPKRSLSLSLPVRLDDGTVRVFRGFRSVHSIALGPSIGGVRYKAGLSSHECDVLAGVMTLKAAIADLPLGGAKGGINVDPDTLSEAELQRLTRRYTSELVGFIGPQTDICAPDVGTGEQVMAWMLDTWNENLGNTAGGVVVGKPLALGGSYGSKGARGYGAATVARRVLEERGEPLEGLSVAVYGYGDVGRSCAERLVGLGARIVAVADGANGGRDGGGAYDSGGLDLGALHVWREEHGSAQGFGSPLTADELLSLDVDLLVLASDYGSIHAGNEAEVRARYILEATNRAVMPGAERALKAAGRVIIPDLIASSGGLVANYLEWVQDASSFFWMEQDVLSAIDTRLLVATDRVLRAAKQYGCDLRAAALTVALDRLSEASALRGVYP